MWIEMMQKIIFLDFDGVLNTQSWYQNTFDPNAVACLSILIEKTGADIVVSSSWKSLGYDWIKEMWKERDLPGNVIGITPNTISDEMLLKISLEDMEEGALKGYEIEEWLSKNGKQLKSYVIIDDNDTFLPKQRPYLVKTNPFYGLSENDVEKAINILNE